LTLLFNIQQASTLKRAKVRDAMNDNALSQRVAYIYMEPFRHIPHVGSLLLGRKYRGASCSISICREKWLWLYIPEW